MNATAGTPQSSKWVIVRCEGDGIRRWRLAASLQRRTAARAKQRREWHKTNSRHPKGGES